MKIGIVAATNFEIQPTIDFLLQKDQNQSDHDFEILITGIGCVATTYQMLDFIRKKSPNYLVQAGIGGAFNSQFQLAETTLIKDEVIGDLGVNENNSFKDLFEMSFMEPQSKPYVNGRLVNPDFENWDKYDLPVSRGLTVNEITTSSTRINQLNEKYNCDIESMEGAAFHYVCLLEKVPFLQLRAASNYVGERNKNNWKLKDSITNLNQSLIKIIHQIQ